MTTHEEKMPSQDGATFDHGYALLIGVGETAEPKWSLPVTVEDVQAIYTILIDPTLCAYPNNEQHVRLLCNADATRKAILDGWPGLKPGRRLTRTPRLSFTIPGMGG